MKRHIQLPGVRKWAADDLLELQQEGLKILDKFYGQYGDMVIEGCRIDKEKGTISPGLVGLTGKDHEGKTTYKVCLFKGAESIEVFPVYLTLSFTEHTRDYLDAVVRPIAYEYEASLQMVRPTEGNYLELSENKEVGFLDVIQNALHRFVTDIEKLKVEKLGDVESYGENETVANKINTLEEKMPSFLDHEPTELDDKYHIGVDVWTLTTDGNKKFWRCYDNTPGAAVWKEFGTGAGGGGSYGGAVYLTGQTNFNKASIIIKEGILQ